MCYFNSLSIATSLLVNNKEMCVLLFDVFKHLLLTKTDVLKTCWKKKFFVKKI